MDTNDYKVTDATILQNREEAKKKLPELFFALGLQGNIRFLPPHRLTEEEQNYIHDEASVNHRRPEISDGTLIYNSAIYSCNADEHIENLQKPLQSLRKYGMNAEIYQYPDGYNRGFVELRIDVSGEDFSARLDKAIKQAIVDNQQRLTEKMGDNLRDGELILLKHAEPRVAAEIAGNVMQAIIGIVREAHGDGVAQMALGSARGGRQK